MDIETLLLAFWDPGLGEGFVHALAFTANLAFILCGATLLAYMCRYLWHGLPESPEEFRRKPTAANYIAAAAITLILIALSVFAASDQPAETVVSGSYSINDLFRLIVTILDPLLDIRHLADNPIKEFFGLNLIVRAVVLYILAAALQFSAKRSGNAAVHFSIFLKERLLADPPEQTDPSGTEDGEKAAKDETQLLIERLLKLLISGGSAVFAAFVLGSDDMRESISDVLEIFKETISMITLLSNVETGGGASGFFSNVLYILLSLVMLAIYVTAALMLIIFIQTILSRWSKIVNWVIARAKAMRTGVAAVLLAAVTLASVIGAGVCLKKYPILQLEFEGGLAGVLHIVVNYAVIMLGIVIFLTLVAFSLAFLSLVVSYAWNTVKQKHKEWGDEKDFGGSKYWKTAKASACIILTVIFLVLLSLCYDELRGWIMRIFNPGEGIFSPVQVFEHTAVFAMLLGGLVLLISTAAVLGFIVCWGIFEFFLTTRKTVITTASKLVKETLTTLLNTLALIPFFLRQACLTAKSVILLLKAVIQTVLQIFTGYRTESDKNNAIFMAACFASLASLLNTFFGLYQFYGGGENIASFSPGDWVRTICTLAISCAAQLAMLVFGMKAGEGLAEQRIPSGDDDKNRPVRIITQIVLVIGILAIAGFLYALLNDALFYDNKDNVFQFRDLVQYIPQMTEIVVVFMLYFWLKKKCRRTPSESIEPQTDGEKDKKDKKAEKAEKDKQASMEGNDPQPDPNQFQKSQRLPFYWYLAVYLLLMIISTGFAYSNLFGYYAHGAKVHERVYSQVRYKADQELQISERVAEVVQTYANNTRHLGNLFSQRAASAMRIKDSKVAALRSRVENERSGEYVEQNRRDRFIGQTKDLEQIVSNIQSFLTAQYDNIGRTAAIRVDEYDHYWGYSSHPSYSTTCIKIHLDGDLADKAGADRPGETITVGDLVTEERMEFFPETAHSSLEGKQAPDGRIKDPASPSQSIIKTTRYVFHADKYDILKELFNQYERIENRIYNFTIPDGMTPDKTSLLSGVTPSSGGYSGFVDITLTMGKSGRKTISDQIYPDLDRNAQLDGIRANIASLYQDGTGSSDVFKDSKTVRSVPMPELPMISESYLNPGKSDTGSKPAGNGDDGKTALSEYENLSDYIDRALTLNNILLSFDTDSKDGKWGEAVYKTQQYRNYARGIAHLEFQVSYDALFRGHFNLNPVPKDINGLYTTSAIAVFLLQICLLIDMLAFFSGLLLFKSVYLFGRNTGILRMGYLNYEIALLYLFTVPRDFHSRVLHLAFMYKILHGDASTPAGLEDGDMGDIPLNNNDNENEPEPEENSSDSSSEPDPEPSEQSEQGEQGEQGGPDEQAEPVEEDTADSEEPDSASNPQPVPDDTGEPEETIPETEKEDKNESENEDMEKKIAGYFQDMDCLHRIMRSEDYKRLDETMTTTLKILGITVSSDGNDDRNDSYASLQMWLRSFVEENDITFDELFPPQKEE